MLSMKETAVLEAVRPHTKKKQILGHEIITKLLAGFDKVASGQELREIINNLRVDGWPICADGEGYWYARTATELTEFIGSLEGRARKILFAVAGMKRAGYERIEGERTSDPLL
jgi:hypothetical protein